MMSFIICVKMYETELAMLTGISLGIVVADRMRAKYVLPNFKLINCTCDDLYNIVSCL